MEFEVDLYVSGIGDVGQQLRDKADTRLEVLDLKQVNEYSIRLNEPMKETTIDNVVLHFLSIIESLQMLVCNGQCTLRVGVFFNVEEIAAFSVFLSNKTIQALANLNVEIDVTGYPCSDEE